MKTTNGILFPGGSRDLINSEYAKAGKILYDLALDSNKNGIYFPIWGTCLGYELLTVLQANQTNWLTSCNSSDVAMNLDFYKDFDVDPNSSKIFKEADKKLIDVSIF